MQRVFVYGAQMLAFSPPEHDAKVVATATATGEGMRTEEATDGGQCIAAARIAGMKVDFVARGFPVFEPAFASLEAIGGSKVGEEGAGGSETCAYGVVVELSDERWSRMQLAEKGYDVVQVEAQLLHPRGASEQSSEMRCVAFCVCAAERMTQAGKPSARYAAKLLAGAQLHSLPPQVTAQYAALATSGSRLSLRLEWLKPAIIRFGFVPVLVTALLILALLGAMLGSGVYALVAR